jgi:transposase
LPHLDERQRRLLLGAEARVLGHGGIRIVARAAGVREATVSAGVGELEAGTAPLGRVRRPGGGRKRRTETDPGLLAALLGLVEPEERGDPMGPLRWTTKSLRTLAGELAARGHPVGPDTVARVLHEQGFSLQANAKTLEGKQHPDRDGQFRYLNEQVADHQGSGDPVISVDSKKKERVGDFATPGRTWRPGGHPIRVRDHDFPDENTTIAVPFGIYDLAHDSGWVNVGTDHNTAAFAVESIRRWWKDTGHRDHPGATRLLITADAGGSNGHRTRTWKTELAALALETGLQISICHFPPGTSKWNKIEHRLFSHITMNWAGRPLTSHEVILQSIAATTTRTGLNVHAELDTNTYDLGIRISDAHLDALPLTHHDWHGDWNYTLHPTTFHIPDPPPPRPRPTGTDPTWLTHPTLTGIPTHQWPTLLAQLTPDTTSTPHHPLTLNARLSATLIHHYTRLPFTALAPLYGVSARTLYNHTKPLHAHLTHTHQLPHRGPHYLATLQDLYDIAVHHNIPHPTPT